LDKNQDDNEVADIFRAANFARRKTARTDLNALGRSPVVAKLRKVSIQIYAYITPKNADGARVALERPSHPFAVKPLTAI
jgi:hypothetical protein